MVRNILLALALTLLYIFLLTVVFENFINKPSSTLLAVLALALFVVLSAFYAQFIIKTLKKRPK